MCVVSDKSRQRGIISLYLFVCAEHGTIGGRVSRLEVCNYYFL